MIEKAQSLASRGSSPARTSGSTRAMNPLAWQPGLAMRFERAMRSRRPASSGKPYSHPSAVRCAVEVSMTTVSGLSTMAAASTAAASGRQRNTTSAEFMASRRADGFFLSSSGRTTVSTSRRPARRSRMRRPVVPADPSTNTFFMRAIIPKTASPHRSRAMESDAGSAGAWADYGIIRRMEEKATDLSNISEAR